MLGNFYEMLKENLGHEDLLQSPSFSSACLPFRSRRRPLHPSRCALQLRMRFEVITSRARRYEEADTRMPPTTKSTSAFATACVSVVPALVPERRWRRFGRPLSLKKSTTVLTISM